MDNLHDIVRKYKSEVIPTKLDVTELMTYVHSYLDVVEIDPLSLGPLIKLSKCNITHMLDNYGNKKLTNEKFDFKAYHVVKNYKSLRYYHEVEKNIISGVLPVSIAILIERHSEYIYASCSTLHMELLLKRGIDEFDYNNETPSFINYIVLYDQYKKLDTYGGLYSGR